MILLTDKPK